ncbi:NADPH:quinone reductase-like Zn-dependent oxidoreductase [Klebsiella sp. BIGb0407]|nr:hypothetical protein [Klebsiella sp. BIGb0407]MCS3434295.1 NADPH:quinone reductase-like Zn-dependent oxidoreductase [Klebsiella sp. BIGb0407]
MMYVTAYGALVEYGNLQAVIHAALRCVSLAAIQMGNMLDAKTIALTHTFEKIEMLFKADVATVIATVEQDMVAEINSTTDGAGAHIVLILRRHGRAKLT